MTRYDPAALERLIDGVAPHWKGAPLGPAVRFRELGASGLEALSLPLPQLLLKESALAHNIARMAAYVEAEGALLAPHVKTTMSPEIIARQIDAGAWAVTVATPAQLDTVRRMGVERVVLANQLVEPAVIRWAAAEPDLELICLVDSVEGVALLDGELSRPVKVLLEAGKPDGRAGVRSLDTAREVARAVGSADNLELLGIECFEGLAMDPADVDASIAAADEQLAFVRAIAGDLGRRFVSAGGSAFFDRVLAAFPRPEFQVVLRSGCYVSQDGGVYDEMSPLAGRGQADDPLRDALELWGAVLSRPEPDVAVVGAGRRDAPYDQRMPVPVEWRSRDGARGGELPGAEVLRLNDQHATISVPPGPEVGDLVRFTVSHPCGAFDRWRVIPLVDDDRRVTGAVHTVF